MFNQKLILDATKSYLEILNSVKDSDWPEQIKVMSIDLIDDLTNYINWLQEVNTKKKYVGSGSFDMRGRIDLRPGLKIPLILFKRRFEISTDSNLRDQIIAALKICGIERSDILYLFAEMDIIKDLIQFEFVYQTDTIQQDNLDISVELPALYSLGYTQFNKIVLRYAKENIDPIIYDYPLLGFALPYNQTSENHMAMMSRILANIQQNGELADMRALIAFPKNDLSNLVNVFKERKWKRIITPTEKWWLRNGTYAKF